MLGRVPPSLLSGMSFRRATLLTGCSGVRVVTRRKIVGPQFQESDLNWGSRDLKCLFLISGAMNVGERFGWR
jgi:hypothetical protein